MTEQTGPAEPLWGRAACLETARRIGHDRWLMLRLVYERGLTQREIAQQLDLEPNIVGREIAHGLRVMAAVIGLEPPSRS